MWEVLLLFPILHTGQLRPENEVHVHSVSGGAGLEGVGWGAVGPKFMLSDAPRAASRRAHVCHRQGWREVESLATETLTVSTVKCHHHKRDRLLLLAED